MRMMVIVRWLYRNYFRVETSRLEHLPPGRVMVVGNHSAQLAYNGMLVAAASARWGQPRDGALEGHAAGEVEALQSLLPSQGTQADEAAPGARRAASQTALRNRGRAGRGSADRDDRRRPVDPVTEVEDV
jgi:hypothetical protein